MQSTAAVGVDAFKGRLDVAREATIPWMLARRL
jgi:hypothetical protein